MSQSTGDAIIDAPESLGQVVCDTIGDIVADGILVWYSVQYMLATAPKIPPPEPEQEEQLESKVEESAEPPETAKQRKKSKRKPTDSTPFILVIRNDGKKIGVRRKNSNYTLPTHPFGVRGHWRRYKSGKTVWIKEYTKNTSVGGETRNQPKKLKGLDKRSGLPDASK